MKISSLALATWALLAVACSSSSSSGGGSSSGGSTAGEQCTRVMNAFCTHAVNDCHLAITVTDCVNTGVNACCKDQCSTTALSSESSIDACVVSMQMLSCADVSAGNAAANCRGVVKIRSFEPGIEPESVGAQLSSSR